MHFRVENDYLYCDALRVQDILGKIGETPFYLYSAGQIRENYVAYAAALAGIPARIAYAVKANGNLALLRILRELGSGAALVSGNELRMALLAGFNPSTLILNGNGKRADELTLAVQHGTMINIDSEFDLFHIDRAARDANKPVDVLLRVNPDIRPDVHPYVATGMHDSKFGIRTERLPWFLETLKGMPLLHLAGLHCHLGSTIKDTRLFHDATALMMQYFDLARAQGFLLRYLNLGGGLGIDYEHAGDIPTPHDLIDAARAAIRSAGRDLHRDNITLIVEPGRSIVGNAGVLICRVTGVKANGDKHFIVIDGSMAELIRPSLYGAHHHIDFVEPVDGKSHLFDIVGPVCESADFLGKARALPIPPEGTGVVVYDAGAYGYAMSSNYNAHLRPAEYLVDGDQLILIRRAETFDDLIRPFPELVQS